MPRYKEILRNTMTPGNHSLIPGGLMGIFSRTPMTADETVAKMRTALDLAAGDPRRYEQVIELRRRFGDDHVEAADPHDQFWLNALPTLAVLRWGSSTGPAAGMMEAIPGFWGWLGGCQNPPDAQASAVWNEIDQRVVNSDHQ
jgi:hypothetical protein